MPLDEELALGGGSGSVCGNGSVLIFTVGTDESGGSIGGGIGLSFVVWFTGRGRLGGGGCFETAGDFGGATDSESLISPSSLASPSSTSIGPGAGGGGGEGGLGAAIGAAETGSGGAEVAVDGSEVSSVP